MMVLKKKTIIIITLVLLLFAAGYLSSKYGKAVKVNAGKEDNKQNILTSIQGSKSGSTQVAAGYFIDTKLARDNQRISDKQTFNEMINNKNTSKESKTKAENQLLNLVNYSEKEMILEALIKSKGYEDALVLMSDDSVNITVKAKELNSDQVNQIKNIVCKESSLPATKVMVQPRD